MSDYLQVMMKDRIGTMPNTFGIDVVGITTVSASTKVAAITRHSYIFIIW